MGGVNVRLREAADADAWWVLNPDTEPQPTAMARLVARLEVGDCEVVGRPSTLPMVGCSLRRTLDAVAGAFGVARHGSALATLPNPAAIERDRHPNGAR